MKKSGFVAGLAMGGLGAVMLFKKEQTKGIVKKLFKEIPNKYSC